MMGRVNSGQISSLIPNEKRGEEITWLPVSFKMFAKQTLVWGFKEFTL